jgi:Flp pilus assembly protein TadB
MVGKLRDDTATHLEQARRMAREVRTMLGGLDEQSGRARDGRMLLACLDAQAERLAAELVAWDAILTARQQMGAAVQAAFRDIYGADPPVDYVFPVHIPN